LNFGSTTSDRKYLRIVFRDKPVRRAISRMESWSRKWKTPVIPKPRHWQSSIRRRFHTVWLIFAHRLRAFSDQITGAFYGMMSTNRHNI
jgi:hypothetical protein